MLLLSVGIRYLNDRKNIWKRDCEKRGEERGRRERGGGGRVREREREKREENRREREKYPGEVRMYVMAAGDSSRDVSHIYRTPSLDPVRTFAPSDDISIQLNWSVCPCIFQRKRKEGKIKKEKESQSEQSERFHPFIMIVIQYLGNFVQCGSTDLFPSFFNIQ